MWYFHSKSPYDVFAQFNCRSAKSGTPAVDRSNKDQNLGKVLHACNIRVGSKTTSHRYCICENSLVAGLYYCGKGCACGRCHTCICLNKLCRTGAKQHIQHTQHIHITFMRPQHHISTHTPPPPPHTCVRARTRMYTPHTRMHTPHTWKRVEASTQTRARKTKECIHMYKK